MKIVSRADAIGLGLKTYFTGKACPHGHLSERKTSDCGCLDCRRIASKKRRLDKGCKPWYATEEERKEGRRRSLQKYANANPEKLKKSQAAYKEKHPEKRAATVKKWDAANPESKRISSHKRRARKASIGGTLSRDLTEKLLKRQKGKCACCGGVLSVDFQLDHIMPIALGGSNTDENIQLLHGLCNRRKAAKHPIDFMQERGFLL